MFWYILWTYIYIYIAVYVVCGVVFRVVCCVVPLYLQASVTEGANIRAVMPLLKVAKVVAVKSVVVKSVVVKRKRSFTSLASEDAPVLSDDGAACFGKLDCHFKEFYGLSTSVDVQA